MTTTDLGISMTNERIQSGEARSVSGAKGGKGGSWFEVLAGALGDILGERVSAMITAKNDMVKNYKADLDTEKGEQQSKEYMQAMTNFQVQSQIFGMESNAVKTAIDSIGGGLKEISKR
ncbi:hypothetical protein [Lysobacter sp. CA199]|uniref:hypothetical protein n=1 Tax=Lysobacter sp. CA199 TaxID=3455608 RepID=UPI003F8D3ED1